MARNTPVPVPVDDPHGDVAHGGDGHHGDEPHMLVGHDGKLHPSNLRFYFVSAEQQFEASKLGMWLFLATEILLFGGMFVAYGIFRVLYPEVYEEASVQLDTVLGAMNTLVLLLSSLTMAWAIRAAQMDNRKLLIQMLSATIALASFFLVVKYFEYAHKFEIGIFPGINFELDEGTRSVSDLSGAVPITPIFERPVQTADAIQDAEAVDSEAGGIQTTGDAPLTGDDQAAPAGDMDAAPDGPDPSEVAAGANVTGDGASVPQEEVLDVVAGTEALEGDLSEASGMSAAGLETEHGDEAAHGDDHGRTGEIFANRRAGIFFAIYYMMTGIHAIHILIGIVAIGFLVYYSYKGKYSSVYYTPVENVGLYWHIVDIIWIFVFPLMYLI